MAEVVTLQNINPNTFELQNYSSEDNALIFSNTVESTFDSNIDTVEYFIYDLNNNILFQNSAYPSYYINNNVITLNPEENLKNAGFVEGNYNTLYNFVRPKLGSNFSDKYFISQVSSDRTEIRLDTTKIPNDVVISSSLELINEINNSNLAYYDFYLNFGNNQLLIANNALLDTSDPNNPTVLIKLYEPLPQQFTLKNELWVVTQVSEPVAYNINISNVFDIEDDYIYLKGPNLNINIKDQINNSTTYTNLSNLYSNSNSQGSGSFQYQLNSLLAETGIEINIDYSDYSNFIHFSSAQTRLENFYYKLSLIEGYQLSASLSSGTSNNYYVSSSNVIWQNKIDEIITGFDGYEYYLYYNSGSTCWPKIGNTPPYTNETVNSVNGQAWFVSQSLVAETYDLLNNNTLTLAIPSYIIEDSSNSQFELFVEMIGQMFDNVFVYLKDVTNKYNSDNRLSYGVSKELVADILRDMGIKIYQNNFSSDDLYTALIGFTPSGSLYNLPYTTTQLPVPSGTFFDYIDTYITASATGSLIPTEDINFETYKRIYHNLPYLLKKKGTLDGLKTLITLYGIPDTILGINEFGGQDKNNSTTDSWQNVYNYSYESDGTANNCVYIPIKNLNSNFGNEFPRTIQFRFKTNGLPTSSIPYSQSLVANSANGMIIALEYTGSGYDTGSYSGATIDSNYLYANLKFIFSSKTASIYLPFFDGNWWSVTLTADTNTDTTYTLYAGNKTEGYYGGINYEASSSFTSTDFWNIITNSNLILGTGSISFGGKTYLPFSGSYQEFRYYSVPVAENVFESYVLNPYSIEGISTTSTQDTLAFRLPLGGELYIGSSSIHPAITGSSPVTQSFSSAPYTASFSGTTTFIPNIETFYFNQPAVGIKNIISNKIRTQEIVLPYSSSDNNIPNDKTLSPYISVQQNSYLSSSFTQNIDYVEVAFSPQNIINNDIIEELGYFNIGEYIGDPRQVSSSLDSYPELDALRDYYFQKYSSNYDVRDYVRLIKFFDNSLFKMISDWTPARTSLASGIVIKQHILERNKYPTPQLAFTSSLFTGSIEIGSIEANNGGTLPNLNNQTSSIILPGNYNTTVTQVWNNINEGPLGPVTNVNSFQTEFFDGEFDGAKIVVTTQSLNSNNILLNNQAFYPTIADYQNLNVKTTSSISESALSPADRFTIPFNNLQRYISYYNISSHQYLPNYDTISDINCYVTASFKGIGSSGGSVILYLSFYEDGITINQTEIASIAGTIPFDTQISASININNFNIKSGSTYYLGIGEITGIEYTASFNSLSSWTVTSVNPQVVGYPNDPNVYQQSTFPGNLNLYPEYNAILNNVYTNRLSEEYFDVDYSQQDVLPVNQEVIISQSAVYAQVQDSNYTLARNINPRYIGSKNTSAKYNVYTPGDISYGKTAAIDDYVNYFIYFDWIGRSNPEYPGGGNVHATYLIDIEGNATPLTGDNKHLFTVSNIFVQGQTATILPAVYAAGKFNPIVEVVEGGALIDTIVFMSGSGILNAGYGINWDNNGIGFSTGYNRTSFTASSLNILTDSGSSGNIGWLYPFLTGSSPTQGLVSTYQMDDDITAINLIDKSTLSVYPDGFPQPTISNTYFPLQKYDYIRFGNTSSTSMDNLFIGDALYQITSITIGADYTNSSSLTVYPLYTSSALTLDQLAQNWRIMRRVPKDNYILVKYMPAYKDPGLLIPENFNPNYDPYDLAKKAGVIT